MRPWPSLADKAFCLTNDSHFAAKFPAQSGENIFYFDSPPGNVTSGSSRPVFVLIHGLGDEADSWRHLIPILNARGYRVLALDLPGFGRSATMGKINIKSHTAAVLAFLEAVIPARPVVLAGNSLGALVTEEAAFKIPNLVKALVLIDGSIPGGPANPGIPAVIKLLLSRKWYRAYIDDPDGAWASLRPYYADLPNMPREDREFLRTRVMDRVRSASQEKAFFATQRSLIWTYMFAASRFAKKVRSFKGRILLLWGENDRIIPPSSAETFKLLRSDIELQIIKGAGHLPQQEKPGETAQFMADFVERAVD